MATRATQPYRRGGSRAPSPVLDRMLAGRGPLPKPGVGAALVQAMDKPKRSQPKKPPLKIPYG